MTITKNQMPLGQVPVLEIDEIKLPQSLSIARFLAKQFQLAGRDNIEQAKIDAVADTINDLIVRFVSTRSASDESNREKVVQQFFAEELTQHLQNLEVLGKLYGNGGSFFVGNQLTWVDLLFYDVGETFIAINENCLNRYPWLRLNLMHVAKQPNITEYLKNRIETLF